MKRVDFHLLPGSTYTDSVDYCARLCEKVVGLGQQLHLHTDSEFELEKLDEGLWSFKASSFLPHTTLTQEGSAPRAQAPVTLGNSVAALSKASAATVLVTLTLKDVNSLQNSSFDRLILLIPNDDPQINIARGLYKQYKQAGSEVHLHDLRPKY